MQRGDLNTEYPNLGLIWIPKSLLLVTTLLEGRDGGNNFPVPKKALVPGCFSFIFFCFLMSFVSSCFFNQIFKSFTGEKVLESWKNDVESEAWSQSRASIWISKSNKCPLFLTNGSFWVNKISIQIYKYQNSLPLRLKVFVLFPGSWRR